MSGLGTMEEKAYQRQLSKEGLASVVEDKDQINELGSQVITRFIKILFCSMRHTYP